MLLFAAGLSNTYKGCEWRWHGGFLPKVSWWWRIDFTEDIWARLRKEACSRDDLSMNVLFDLLGMVVTAWVLTVHVGARPEYSGKSILMRRDNMSAVH